ncbi:hypothetical protein KVR01_005658 [Diaporthe batatas]|uniref:uncharacterized protein n=1 Tax=Diaporthe batatas TaxID=748121 RepID=UPI001D04E024|nr:uncharacterized protein KVR01_005658 [Diaporthe batatas]KAG8165383.1 hypothetical protein KVR01_005658 [Diaporthe batatas]
MSTGGFLNNEVENIAPNPAKHSDAGAAGQVFSACASIDFIALIDQTSLAASLSTVFSALRVGTQASWIAGGYFTTSTSLQLAYGRFPDVRSTKYVLLALLLILLPGSLASSLSQTAIQLIMIRAHRWHFGSGCRPCYGVNRLIGGTLASSSKEGWRWIFRLKEDIVTVDFFRCFLTLYGSVLFMLGLTWAEEVHPWNSVAVILPIVLGFCTSYPLIPLYIFQQEMFNGVCITMFINGWNFVVQMYYIPTFYHLAYGYSTVLAASLLPPLTLMQTLSSTVFGLIVTWRGRYRESISIGWVVWAVGLGLCSTLDQESGLKKQIGWAILTGFGVGQTLHPSLIAIQAGFNKQNMAVVTGTRNFVRKLGSTLGLTVTGTIINNVVRSGLASTEPDLSEHRIASLLRDPTSVASLGQGDEVKRALLEAYHVGFQRVFDTMAAFAAFSGLIAFVLMPQIDLDKKEEEDQKS